MTFLDQERKFRKREMAKFGNFISTEQFEEYMRSLKRIKELQDELEKIESEVYGTVDGNIEIFTSLRDDILGYRVRGKITINPITEIISVNRRNPQIDYVDSRKPISRIVSEKFPFSDLGIAGDNNVILKVLRKLFKQKLERIRDKENEILAEMGFTIEEHEPYSQKNYLRLSLCNNHKIRNLYNEPYELEEFFNLFISNTEAIINFLHWLEKNSIDIGNKDKVIEEFKKYYEILTIFPTFSSGSPCKKKIEELNDSDVTVSSPSFEDALKCLEIIIEEYNELQKEYKKYSTMESMLKEYVDLCDKVNFIEQKELFSLLHS